MKASALEKGMFALLKNSAYQVIEREFVKPGKGGAFVRLKLKDCVSGAVLRETMSSEASVEEASIERRPAQFLYADQNGYHFMDSDTYEQFSLPIENHEKTGNFMLEGDSYDVIMWDSTPIKIDIPLKMTFEVIDAPEGVRGNTVSGSVKTVTIQNDIAVKAPLFIKNGDHIVVNTESGEYVERATR